MAELTPRQRLVLESFIADPHENRIAKRTGLKAQTVRNHIADIQLSIRNLFVLVEIAQEMWTWYPNF
jgi:FixJ family two-component response regulator